MMSARLFTMKTPSIFSILTATALVGIGATAFAQVATEPVGFVSQDVPANSDAVIGVPLYRAAAFKGKIDSISGNVITVVGTPGFTADQFVQDISVQPAPQPSTFVVSLATGSKEGLTATITANGTNTLTVIPAEGDDLTGLATEQADGAGNGDEIDIIPLWTPGTLFPDGVTAGVQLLLIPNGAAGVNLGANPILFSNGTGWLNSNNGFADATHLPLRFGQGLIMRNTSGSPITVTSVGAVPMSSHRLVIRTLADNTPQDVWFSYASPVPTFIGTAGLGFSPGDQLLAFDNSATGINKAATDILFYNGAGGWLDSNNGFANVNGTFELKPGFGYVFRKAATPTPQTFVWQDVQTYLTPAP